MWRSWKVGSAFGIGLYVHWSFLLAPLYAFVSVATVGSIASAAFMASIVLCLFGCILLHELGHALAARAFGIDTRDITLYPIGGVARLERMSEKPSEEAIIALAGPAVNVVIAMVLGCVLGVGLIVNPSFISGFVAGEFVFVLALANLGLVVFNMVPAFPMDGGRVLRALLTNRLGRLTATRIAAWLGGVLALALAVWGIIMLHPLIPILAVFLFLAGQQELYVLERRRRQAEEEPVVLEALEDPVSRLPQVTTYLWDAERGEWVRQPNTPFYRSF